jgi:hypothetical protein
MYSTASASAGCGVIPHQDTPVHDTESAADFYDLVVLDNWRKIGCPAHSPSFNPRSDAAVRIWRPNTLCSFQPPPKGVPSVGFGNPTASSLLRFSNKQMSGAV